MAGWNEAVGDGAAPPACAEDVAAAGGWTGTQALTTIYQHATPDKILEVVEVGA